MERRGREGKGISSRKWDRMEQELERNSKYEIGEKSKLEEGTSKALLREKREDQERWWWKGGGGDDGPRAAILSTRFGKLKAGPPKTEQPRLWRE